MIAILRGVRGPRSEAQLQALEGVLAPHGFRVEGLSFHQDTRVVLLTLAPASPQREYLLDGAYRDGELHFGAEGTQGYSRLMGLPAPAKKAYTTAS